MNLKVIWLQNSAIKKLNLANLQKLEFVRCSREQEITVNERVTKKFYDKNDNRIDEQGRRLDDAGNLIE